MKTHKDIDAALHAFQSGEISIGKVKECIQKLQAGLAYELPDYIVINVKDYKNEQPVYFPSRRDYFAAAALQGVLSRGQTKDIVTVSVNLADALIAELDKKNEG